MATPATTDEAAAFSATDAATTPAVVDHDRGTTPVGSGRITFKGHNAKAGYPYRVWEGQVQAYVDGAWVDAPDAQAV